LLSETCSPSLKYKTLSIVTSLIIVICTSHPNIEQILKMPFLKSVSVRQLAQAVASPSALSRGGGGDPSVILASKRWGLTCITSDTQRGCGMWWKGQSTLVLVEESSCPTLSSLSPPTLDIGHRLCPTAQDTAVAPREGHSFIAAIP
jgi:hypothetical protein